MPLDHYVSQVHLKNFYSPELGEMMYAIKKADQKMFTPNSQSVCRIEGGSTNLYLRDERIIEEFLKGIEPKYNSAISKVRNNEIDSESIYVVAGFVSYIVTCSPGGMRIYSEPFRGVIEETARYLDNLKDIPPPPAILGGESLSELLENGKIAINIDEKYPQAYGITSIFTHTSAFGNSSWEVLINPYEDSLFFSSDYPVAIEKTNDPMVLNRIIPLTPRLAVRIIPNIFFDRKKPDFSFSNFICKQKQLSRREVRCLNQLFVRCAESMVFFSKMEHWISRFVEKNSRFRIVPKTKRIPKGDRNLLWFTQEIVESYDYK